MFSTILSFIDWIPDSFLWIIVGLTVLSIIATIVDRLVSLIPTGYNLIPPILAILLVCGISLYFEHHYDGLVEMQKVAVAEGKIIQLQKDQQASNDKYETALKEKKTEIVYVTQTQVKEVTKYVTKEINAHCSLPYSVVVVLSAASRGVPVPPEPTPGAYATPAKSQLSDIIGNTVENYGICHQNAEQVKSLQQWILEQKAKLDQYQADSVK